MNQMRTGPQQPDSNVKGVCSTVPPGPVRKLTVSILNVEVCKLNLKVPLKIVADRIQVFLKKINYHVVCL